MRKWNVISIFRCKNLLRNTAKDGMSLFNIHSIAIIASFTGTEEFLSVKIRDLKPKPFIIHRNSTRFEYKCMRTAHNLIHDEWQTFAETFFISKNYAVALLYAIEIMRRLCRLHGILWIICIAKYELLQSCAHKTCDGNSIATHRPFPNGTEPSEKRRDRETAEIGKSI